MKVLKLKGFVMLIFMCIAFIGFTSGREDTGKHPAEKSFVKNTIEKTATVANIVVQPVTPQVQLPDKYDQQPVLSIITIEPAGELDLSYTDLLIMRPERNITGYADNYRRSCSNQLKEVIRPPDYVLLT